MLKLKDEVVEHILSLLKNGKCDEFRSYMVDISRVYRGINNFFVSTGRFYQSIEVPEDTISGVSKCIDSKMRISIDVDVGIEWYATSDGHVLMEEVEKSSEYDFLDDYAMMFTLENVEDAFWLIREVNKRDMISWVPNDIRVKSLDEIMDYVKSILSANAEGGYQVKLGTETHPKVVIKKILVRYTATYNENGIELYFHRDLYEFDSVESKPITMDKLDQVEKEIKELVSKYGVPVKVILSFYPYV